LVQIRGIDGNLERKPLAKEAEDAVRFGGGVIDHSCCFSSIDGGPRAYAAESALGLLRTPACDLKISMRLASGQTLYSRQLVSLGRVLAPALVTPWNLRPRNW
jgi:hypothetical protein